jgi:DNA-binding MarR family transcriptional regulator
MNVQKLNKKKQENHDSYKSLLILDEISRGEKISQRDLSNKLNIALGLVNSYIKNLISKGYITIKNIPSKRYAYYLTSKGFAEKSRLTYHHLSNYTRIYREARKTLKKLFHDMRKDGARKIVFAGADEIAEIAYITMHETDMELTSIVDEEKVGNDFFGMKIASMNALDNIDYDFIVVTSYVNRDKNLKDLLGIGISKEKIKVIII